VKLAEGTAAVPAARRHIIRRPRLTRMLDESGARIILLVAPAGYGKTTLAREWLDEASRHSAWYRGTPASADVAALAVGVATAAAEIVDGAGDRMRQRLNATDRPEEDAGVLAEMLAEDLDKWPTDAWLAIEDYHLAQGSDACETFVESLVNHSSIRLMLTSRKHPSWANARRRVYGEVFELDRTLLCMSDDEAAAVLTAGGGDFAGIIDRAAGWPAVIGLAAMTKEPSGAGEVPPTLLAYFAEELYQAVPVSRRWDLCQLAIAPALSAPLIDHVFGEDAPDVVDLATNLGVLTPDFQNEPEIHPLLQHFLRGKLSDHASGLVHGSASRIGRFYLDRQEWDGAFAVASTFRDTSLAVEIIRAGLEEALAGGRVSTVARWLEFATDGFADDPILDLAEAELAFRQGAHPQTESLAGRAARRLKAEGADDLAAVAHARAGRAAHLAGDEEKALAHHNAALMLTSRLETEREALWGKFVTLLESGVTTEAESVLESLVQKDTGHVDDALRLASGRYLFSMHAGSAPDIDALLAALHLLPKCRSPMVRSSFLNSCVGGLAFAGRYAEADRIAEQQINDAATYRLGFALPHAYLRRASAACGLRRFREAFLLLDRADDAAKDVEHHWVTVATAITRGLTSLAMGDPQAALRATDRVPGTLVSPALRGEHLAFRGLVYACLGDSARSERLQKQAIDQTNALETTALCALARAVSAHSQDSEPADRLSLDAFDYVCQTQAIDYFVISYRACPALLTSIASANDERLPPIIEAAHDHDLARSIGLDVAPPSREAGDILSRREREVWSLMAQGLSNREIAARLFVSAATVKVHIRHIFEKLGAKTRVDAVIKGQALFPD
jgi:LuxR family transcriptional regulator, maltose regulon positive regulatory protein